MVDNNANDEDLKMLHRCVQCSPQSIRLLNPKCVDCMCDLDCIKYGDCCIDVMINLGLHTVRPQSEFTCISPQLGTSKMFHLKNMRSTMDGYYMKTWFVDDYGTSRACNNHPIQPVSCTATGITYVNMDCAFLNKELDCTHWGLKSECNATNPTNMCKTYIIPPFFAELRYCDARRSQQFISHCMDGFDWYSEQCARYYYLVYGRDGTIYKNIFCYLCNLNILEERPIGQFVPFEILTRFTDLFEKAVYDLPCDGTTAWMDFRVNRCRPIRCDTNKTLVGGYCKHDAMTAQGNSYHLLQQVVMESEDRIPILKQAVHNILSNLSFYISSADYHASVTRGNTVLYVDVWFTITDNILLASFERRVMYMEPIYFYNVKSSPIYQSVDYTAFEHPQSSLSSLGTFASDVDTKILCCTVDENPILDKIYTPITFQLLCSYIEFNSDEYVIENKMARIDHLNLTLYSDEFSVYKNQLRVCFNLFLTRTGIAYNNETVMYDVSPDDDDANDDIKWYLSTVLIALSMLALFITFITYLRFSKMRSQPGKNNMALIINLFLAQLMLLVGVDKIDNIITCQILGVIIHYLWLSMLLWMNVCSYHMFKVFVLHTIIRMNRSNDVKQTMLYCLYANGTPVLIIAVNIVTNYILSSGAVIGYGGNSCYLSTAHLVLYCFILPLSLVILSNIIFFVSTVVSIHSVKQIGKQAGERNNLYIYIKLSVVTGGFWLFAILTNVVNSPAMEYLSIILNSSQGIFLFWSIVLNKTVIFKCRRELRDVTESSSKPKNPSIPVYHIKPETDTVTSLNTSL
ncbi:hypothetical protein SNE40_003923 [Patella caerulea]